MSDLSLSQALRENRLEDFIKQQEAKGIGPVGESHFLQAAARVIKHGPQSDQTSRSALLEDSTEK